MLIVMQLGWVWLRINNIDPHISKPFTAVVIRTPPQSLSANEALPSSRKVSTSVTPLIKYLELHISVTSFAHDPEARNWTSNLRCSLTPPLYGFVCVLWIALGTGL